MSVGFVDPAFFETVRVGSADSLPKWAQNVPLADADRITKSLAQHALGQENGMFKRLVVNYRSNTIAKVFFSQINLQWCQIRIVEKIRGITGRTVGCPDQDNLIELMSLVWDEALRISFVQVQQNVLDAVSRLDLYVIQRAVDDMLIGIRAQSAYIQNVSEAPLYDDPSLSTAYVGGTKSSAGTLGNSSILPDAGTVQAFGKVQPAQPLRLKAMDEPLF